MGPGNRTRARQLAECDHMPRNLTRLGVAFAIVVSPARMKLATLEIWIWPVAAFVCFVLLDNWRPMPLTDDSYQYLNVADNVSHGRGIITTLVHFDSERSNGRIPAPLTTFPPGYPVAIAIVSQFGGSLERAGRVLSGVGYAGTAALLVWGLLTLGSSFLVRQVILLAFVANAVNLSFATAVLTESTYMLISTGAVLGLVALEKGIRRRYISVAIAVLSYTLAGIAYYIRYAGLFLIIAVVSYTVLQLLFHRTRLPRFCLIAMLIPLAIAGAIMSRNIAIVGTWRGGNEMQAHNPLFGVAADYMRAQVHLILGQHAFRFGVWELLVLVGILGISAFLIVERAKWQRPGSAILLVVFCIAIYSGGIFYAGLRTPISFGTRMFLPMLPLYLLIIGTALSSLTPSMLLKSAVLLSVIGYLGSNARDLYQPPAVPQYQILATEYAEPIIGGQSLLDWVQSHVLPADRLFAEEGQATGYFLHRPAISMVGPKYSPIRWDCETVRTEMRRFGAFYLILYKASSNVDDLELLASSSFLTGAASETPACGFAIGAENADVRILELPRAKP